MLARGKGKSAKAPIGNIVENTREGGKKAPSGVNTAKGPEGDLGTQRRKKGRFLAPGKVQNCAEQVTAGTGRRRETM